MGELSLLPPYPVDVKDRMIAIYTQASSLLRAMRGSPLLYAQYVGDRKQLARDIRRNYENLSAEEAHYIAAVIERGKMPSPPANRHKTLKNEKRNREIAWFILKARQRHVGDDRSIEMAVERFGLGRRYIQQIFAGHKDVEAAHLLSTVALLRQVEALGQEFGANISPHFPSRIE